MCVWGVGIKPYLPYYQTLPPSLSGMGAMCWYCFLKKSYNRNFINEIAYSNIGSNMTIIIGRSGIHSFCKVWFTISLMCILYSEGMIVYKIYWVFAQSSLKTISILDNINGGRRYSHCYSWETLPISLNKLVDEAVFSYWCPYWWWKELIIN